MKEENENAVCIEEVDGMPFINWSIVQQIRERGMVFVWDGWTFRVEYVGFKEWEVCWECSLRGACDVKIRKICKAFDFYLKGTHMLELV